MHIRIVIYLRRRNICRVSIRVRMNCCKHSLVRNGLVSHEFAEDLDHIRAVAASGSCVLGEECTMYKRSVGCLRILNRIRDSDRDGLDGYHSAVVLTFVKCAVCAVRSPELVLSVCCRNELTVRKSNLLTFVIIDDSV